MINMYLNKTDKKKFEKRFSYFRIVSHYMSLKLFKLRYSRKMEKKFVN